MTLREIMAAIEEVAPLEYQDDFDNSGLQVGFPDAEISSVLVCIDITEEIVDEAIEKGCNLILSHHPLLFHPLKQVSGFTYQQRCVVKALQAGIAIYSSHTSLDNAPGGVNYKIADIIGLKELNWLEPNPNGESGSGLVGELETPVTDSEFFEDVKRKFGVKCLLHSQCTGRVIWRVALCGGAGAFLLKDAIREGADCFVCGEFHYHDYFENAGTLLAELGHYQSEQFTKDLLRDILHKSFPELRIEMTSIDTNPIAYSF